MQNGSIKRRLVPYDDDSPSPKAHRFGQSDLPSRLLQADTPVTKPNKAINGTKVCALQMQFCIVIDLFDSKQIQQINMFLIRCILRSKLLTANVFMTKSI